MSLSFFEETILRQDENGNISPLSPAMSWKLENGETETKKVRRDRSKSYRGNLKLWNKVTKWKLKYEKYRKGAHRKEKELLKVQEK